jgi:hypothetical protein
VEEISLMKKFAFVLALSMVVAGLSMAAEPEILLPGPGGNPAGIDRTVLWLDNPDFAANTGSSEIIGDYGLETEIANDFILDFDACVMKVTWWGTYWNGYEGTPPGSGFNLRFYMDAGCLPEVYAFSEYLLPGDDCCEALADGGDMFSQYIYEYCLEECLVAGLYWFSVQMADHPFPPQHGRLGADMQQVCRARSGVSTSLIRSGCLRLPCLAICTTPRRCLRMSAFRPLRRMLAGAPSRGSIGRLR